MPLRLQLQGLKFFRLKEPLINCKHLLMNSLRERTGDRHSPGEDFGALRSNRKRAAPGPASRDGLSRGLHLAAHHVAILAETGGLQTVRFQETGHGFGQVPRPLDLHNPEPLREERLGKAGVIRLRLELFKAILDLVVKGDSQRFPGDEREGKSAAKIANHTTGLEVILFDHSLDLFEERLGVLREFGRSTLSGSHGEGRWQRGLEAVFDSEQADLALEFEESGRRNLTISGAVHADAHFVAAGEAVPGIPIAP